MGRTTSQDPCGGRCDHVFAAPLGGVGRSAVLIVPIVVDLEAAGQAEAAVEHEGADEGAGAVAGALQRLGNLLRPRRPATAVRAASVVPPPFQSIGESKLDAPPLGQATLGPSRARGSDTTA